MEAFEPSRLVTSRSDASRLLLEKLVQIGPHTSAHPAPQAAADPPGDGRTLPQLWGGSGAITGLYVLTVITEVTCGKVPRHHSGWKLLVVMEVIGGAMQR